MDDTLPGYKSWDQPCLHQILRAQIGATRKKRFVCDQVQDRTDNVQTIGESHVLNFALFLLSHAFLLHFTSFHGFVLCGKPDWMIKEGRQTVLEGHFISTSFETSFCYTVHLWALRFISVTVYNHILSVSTHLLVTFCLFIKLGLVQCLQTWLHVVLSSFENTTGK